MKIATVTRGPRLVETQYGQRAVFEAAVDGATVKVWSVPKEDVLGLREGDVVGLVPNERGNYRFVGKTETKALKPQTIDVAAAPSRSPVELALIMADIVKTLKNELPDLPPHDIITLTLAVFQQI